MLSMALRKGGERLPGRPEESNVWRSLRRGAPSWAPSFLPWRFGSGTARGVAACHLPVRGACLPARVMMRAPPGPTLSGPRFDARGRTPEGPAVSRAPARRHRGAWDAEAWRWFPQRELEASSAVVGADAVSCDVMLMLIKVWGDCFAAERRRWRGTGGDSGRQRPLPQATPVVRPRQCTCWGRRVHSSATNVSRGPPKPWWGALSLFVCPLSTSKTSPLLLGAKGQTPLRDRSPPRRRCYY